MLSIQKAINSLDTKKNIKANAMRLFNHMGIDGIFGRSDIRDSQQHFKSVFKSLQVSSNISRNENSGNSLF